MTATTPIRWGILGPGSIARSFAGGVADSRTGKLVAIGARNPAKPGLAESFPGARILDGYDALLADPDIDAVYISIPHPGHAQWALPDAWRRQHRPADAGGSRALQDGELQAWDEIGGGDHLAPTGQHCASGSA